MKMNGTELLHRYLVSMLWGSKVSTLGIHPIIVEVDVRQS